MAPKQVVVGEDVALDTIPEETEGLDEYEAVQEETDVAQFPPEHRDGLRGLLFLGALTDEFEYAGHTFAIRTIREGEHLRAGQLTARYEGTIGYQMAYRASIVAACLERVDGEEVYQPLGDKEDVIAKKFDIVLKWFPVVIDTVFEKFIALEGTVKGIAEALGEA